MRTHITTYAPKTNYEKHRELELVNAEHSTAPRGTGNNRPQAVLLDHFHTPHFLCNWGERRNLENNNQYNKQELHSSQTPPKARVSIHAQNMVRTSLHQRTGFISSTPPIHHHHHPHPHSFPILLRRPDTAPP